MFHFQELWDAATHGLNWLIGLGLVAAGWLFGRFQAVAGRRTEAAIERRWHAVERWRRERAAKKAEEKSRSAESARIAQLQRERVGRRFTHHADPDDPGMVGEVIELDPRDPKRNVILVWTSPDGRQPREGDYVAGRRIGIAWKDLTLPQADQRHRTARTIAKSNNDLDGWVEFDPLREDG
jgi:hypothetical protein